jgi:hypothetical protein
MLKYNALNMVCSEVTSCKHLKSGENKQNKNTIHRDRHYSHYRAQQYLLQALADESCWCAGK